MVLSGAVLAENLSTDANSMRDQAAAGLAAWRTGDFDAAMIALTPLAKAGNAVALRVTGAIAVERGNDAAEKALGVEALKDAAFRGDTPALIRLEKMRLAKAPFAPSLDDMMKIEHERATAMDDRVSAWRLSRRFEAGEAPLLTQEDYIGLLKIAAADQAWPKAGEAAWKLCAAMAHDKSASRSWCAKASAQRRSGASIAFMRRRANDG